MIESIANILQLPERCLVKKKITKAFFKRNFDLTRLERSILDDFSILVGMDWIASISPLNANIPAFNDDDMTFEELQVIAIQTNPDQLEKQGNKLLDLVQKYIPYHSLLIVHDENKTIWGACYKRVNTNDPNRRIIEKKFASELINMKNPGNEESPFLVSLGFDKMDKTNLKTLYDSYVRQLVALQTAEIIGGYVLRSAERTKQDVAYLEQIAMIEKEIGILNNMVKKETQTNKQVELNMQIQVKRQDIRNIKKLISE